MSEQFRRETERIALAEGYRDVADYVRDLMRKDFKARGITLKPEEELKEGQL
jgi:hypothetical protein